MLLGILFKVKIMEKSDCAPKFRLVAVAALTGKILHHTADDIRVLYMKRLAVIAQKQLASLLSCRYHRTPLSQRRGV